MSDISPSLKKNPPRKRGFFCRTEPERQTGVSKQKKLERIRSADGSWKGSQDIIMCDPK